MASFLRWWTNAEWLRLSTIDNDGRDCEIDAMLGNPFYKHVILEHQYPLQARKLCQGIGGFRTIFTISQQPQDMQIPEYSWNTRLWIRLTPLQVSETSKTTERLLLKNKIVDF